MSKITIGKPLPAELLGQILNKTDGVPLYVEELTKAILESGELKDAGDHYDYVGAARTVAIPATLRDSLTARLDRFPAAKEIAQIGAAIGREFSYELIAAVAPHTKTELDGALNQLTESGLAFRRGTPPDATYTFKHALVQDTAYDSLLKSRRQELHAKIAHVIEEHYPTTRDTEPELLAHHLTAAGLAEHAIPQWQKAGALALKRLALTDTISHLNQALTLLHALPSSEGTDAVELDLRTNIGTAWMALKGWAAEEVWATFHPALPLARSQGQPGILLRVLQGLYINVLAQGRAAESLHWVEAMFEASKDSDDSDLRLVGHLAALVSYFYLGEFHKAKEHGDQLLSLYDRDTHRPLADIMNHDPKTTLGVWSAQWTWMLGYPDEAVRIHSAMGEHALWRGHPFDMGWSLFQAAMILGFRGEPSRYHQNAKEAERIGHENSLLFLWACMAPLALGPALIEAGQFAEGTAELRAGLALWDASGGKIGSPYSKTILAKGMAHLGNIDEALRLIDEQIEQVERPGWEERAYYAEILRLKGWILSLKGDLRGAEQSYLISLGVACEQEAKSWELRTSTSLARLWQSQGKRKEALDLLKPVYDWFTEGFDTKDLREAKALLEELAA